MIWYNVNKQPLRLHGLLNGFVRIPDELAEKMNDSCKTMYDCCSGGRVRFATDSAKIAVRCHLTKHQDFPAFSPSCLYGVDLYEDGEYAEIFLPPEGTLTIDGVFERKPGRGEIEIGLPILNHVESMEIGICDGAGIYPPREYTISKPVVFYGSSITGGIAATRPGNTYPALLSRMLDFDYVNLGFGGGCRGEAEMAEYISGLNMSIFVMDYDHNAINEEELSRQHNRFFEIIRRARPELPILILSKPDLANDPEKNARRRDIIYSTYSKAQASGDLKVWFFDGYWLYKGKLPRDCTVDFIHPNDDAFAGFAQMLKPAFEILQG